MTNLGTMDEEDIEDEEELDELSMTKDSHHQQPINILGYADQSLPSNSTTPTSAVESASNNSGRNCSSVGNNGGSYIIFNNQDKTADQNWAALLVHQQQAKGLSIDENSPRSNTHMSPEVNHITDLATLEFGQRLPSLESSASIPISAVSSNRLASTTSPTCSSVPNRATSLLSWQPFSSSASPIDIMNPSPQQAAMQSSNATAPHLFPLLSTSAGIQQQQQQPLTMPHHHQHQQMQHHQQQLQQHQHHVVAYNQQSYASTFPPEAHSGIYTTTTDQGQAAPASSVASNLAPIPLEMFLPPASQLLGGQQQQQQMVQQSTTGRGFRRPSNAGTGSNNGHSSSANNGAGYATPSSSISDELGPTSVGSAKQGPSHGKQRSKKESHNRIERKRRDYINSQIVYLSTLLPPELYRDVDGRRNKGSVLRLSVNYIVELREAVSRMAGLKQENNIAQQLIPILLDRIDMLEKIMSEQQGSTISELRTSLALAVSQSGGSAVTGHQSAEHLDALYNSWLKITENNKQRGLAAPNELQQQQLQNCPTDLQQQQMLLGPVPPGQTSTNSSASSSTSDQLGGAAGHLMLQQQQQQQQQQSRLSMPPMPPQQQQPQMIKREPMEDEGNSARFMMQPSAGNPSGCRQQEELMPMDDLHALTSQHRFDLHIGGTDAMNDRYREMMSANAQARVYQP